MEAKALITGDCVYKQKRLSEKIYKFKMWNDFTFNFFEGDKIYWQKLGNDTRKPLVVTRTKCEKGSRIEIWAKRLE